MILFKSVLFFDIIIINCALCDGNSKKIGNEKLPFFRRTVEETNEDVTSAEITTDDTQSQLVSFLVKNVKEIFSDVYDDERPKKSETTTIEKSTLLFRPTKTHHIDSSDSSTGNSMYYSTYDNLHFDRALNSEENINTNKIPSITIARLQTKRTTETSEKMELLKLSKDTSLLENNEMNQMDQIIVVKNETVKSLKDLDVVENKTRSSSRIPRRLCINCNNVNLADCVDPKDKLMPSIVCEKEGDLCYSQHTPFGIIDRGCFNIKNNMSTYVCSCNLCNHFSISDMPHIFNEHDDWIADIVEMSYTKDFRRSIFKSMSCLKCEVNTTRRVDMLNDANCLEGNIGSVPTEDCKQDEVCAIQSISGVGYIKRGCVKTPLYNYWLTLCDSDLCNHEPLSYIY